MTDALRHVLVQRNGIPETPTARVRCRRQEAVIRRMSAINVGMRNAAEDGKVFAVRLEEVEVGRGLVARASPFRKEILGNEAEVIANAQHATGFRLRGRSGGKSRGHGVEQR